jgi:hypothetical protein
MRFARHTFAASLAILSSIVLVGAPAMAKPIGSGGGSPPPPPAVVLAPKVIVGTTYSQSGDPKNMDHMFVKWSKVKGATKYTLWGVEMRIDHASRKPSGQRWVAVSGTHYGTTTVAAKSYTAAPMQAVRLGAAFRRGGVREEVRTYAMYVRATDAYGRTIAQNRRYIQAWPSPGDFARNSNQCAAVYATLIGLKNAGSFAELYASRYIGGQVGRGRMTQHTAALAKLGLAKASQIKIVAGLNNPDWATASRGQAAVTITYLDAAGKAPKWLSVAGDVLGAYDLLKDIASGPAEVATTCN